MAKRHPFSGFTAQIEPPAIGPAQPVPQENPAQNNFSSQLPGKATAFLITKANLTGDLYQLTRVYIENGQIVQVHKEDPTMKIIVADHIAGELLR